MVIFEKGIVYEGIVCLICFDCFKILRYLLCKYLFCYNCLFFYIVSYCKFMEFCLGFYCLVCWDYILNICVVENFEEWIICFFEN